MNIKLLKVNDLQLSVLLMNKWKLSIPPLEMTLYLREPLFHYIYLVKTLYDWEVVF